MGTNYYAIPRVNDDLKNSIKIAIDNNDFEQARRLLPDRIHIGKSSGGWQFLFNHNNGEYYPQTKSGIEVFLKRCDIFNEYGDRAEYDWFWEMVEAKKQGNPEI